MINKIEAAATELGLFPSKKVNAASPTACASLIISKGNRSWLQNDSISSFTRFVSPFSSTWRSFARELSLINSLLGTDKPLDNNGISTSPAPFDSLANIIPFLKIISQVLAGNGQDKQDSFLNLQGSLKDLNTPNQSTLS